MGTATNVTGQVVTFPSGDLLVNTLYCFNWTNSSAVQVKAGASNPNTGTIATRNGALATIDSATFSTASITDDQIQVSASVAQTFSFAINVNTDNLGTLSTAAATPSPTPRTVTVNTNAKNGWYVWASDQNTGLTSPTASATIASRTPGTNSTITNASAGYNTGITSSQVGGTGTITVDPAFVGGSLGKGGGLDTTNRILASSTGTADTAVLTVTNNATIVATTPAATDYADVITITGAGLF
jgi:hypothetical protein